MPDLYRDEKEELLLLLQEKENRTKYNYISTLFPDEGPILAGCVRSIARENYPKHTEFFAAGAHYLERAFIAANQVGKTTAGLYELVIHATGLYPDWWEGKRFNRPVFAWLCGDRAEIIRDGMQKDLMGKIEPGTGLIPKELLVKTTPMPGGLSGAIGTYKIKHVSGGESEIVVKTYQAGKNAFESAKVDVVMLDEECPMDIYTECQIRTITTGGIVYLTFTPDSGLTDTVLHFMDKNKSGEDPKFVALVGWRDVPHLSEQRKKAMLATIPVHMRPVKTEGLPYLGAGAIYPIPETELLVSPFRIPDYWPRTYAFDPGWKRTAALWGAYDQESDTLYIYDEYYRGQAEPEIHSAAIKARGDWMTGIADPHGSRAGRGVSKESFFDVYERFGLNMVLSEPSGPGSVELGITDVYSALSTGKIKIFTTCQNWLYEYRIYRRDDKGKPIADNSHLMDCTRYLQMNFRKTMLTQEELQAYSLSQPTYYDEHERSSITGY